MENITYEDASKQLAEIIEKLENGSITMTEAENLFAQGEKLIKVCYKSIDKAKGKLTQVKETLGKLEEE
jgi:exodeoxyribonuclease VII small subunit